MRYLPLTDGNRRDMLAAIGVGSVDDLFVDVPRAARRDGPVELPGYLGEMEVEHAFAALAARNLSTADVPSFLGAGA
ncbi:MAG: glycine dehydrogenase, partial [Alphaproteobacteria bacterium]|nr:glycine dehydrogenase [Alphaproteobacteria bacterium]